MERILTGIKPTGVLHIGNYFGAIKPAIELSHSGEYDCFYFLANYHALTTVEKGQELRDNSYAMAAGWLACGVDPNKVIFYKQSDIPEIFELTTILTNVTPKGLMNRAHAYKAIVEKNNETGTDTDSGVNMGLYNYPILMSADILLFGTDLVPVGPDQKQHIEIARDIAVYFNNRYGNIFKLPKEYIGKNIVTLLGYDGQKMSKSHGNAIPLFCTESELKKHINRIITDSRMPGEPKDVDCNLNQIYKVFASEEQQKQFDEKLKNGLGWGDAKKELFELVNNYLSPMRERYNYFMSHKEEIDKIFEEGAKKARVIAQRTMEKIRKAIGAK